MRHYIDPSVLGQIQRIGTECNVRRRWTDFCERDFPAELRFLEFDCLTVSLLLPHIQRNMSIGSDGEPDTLTSSSPPKLSCGFCFWRAFCCFLTLEATAAGESPLSWATPSSRPAATETSTGRVLEDCDGLDCLRLKMTGASSVMAFREMDQRVEAKVISALPSIATTIPPDTRSQRRPFVVVAATSTDLHVSNTGGMGPKPRG